MKTAIAVIAALSLSFPSAALASDSSRYYLALGDSLAVGAQPLLGETDEGYADQLHAALEAQHPGRQWKLRKLGCGGESSVSMRFGSQLPADAASCGDPKLYRHRYGRHETQLAAAVAFLKHHRKRVALVTIDIGANDVLGPSGLDPLLTNLPAILAELRAAADPATPIYGMNYFDPFLPEAWTNGGMPALQAEVTQSLALNALLDGLYQAGGVPVADVNSAFSVSNFTLVDGTPLNVVRVCQWTWICAPPPSGPDIHPNAAGYAVIAQAFLALVS
jgi:lysophospholipase L1-like esterase